MAFYHRIYPDLRLIYLYGDGSYSDSEALAIDDAIRADPQFNGDFSQLVNLTESSMEVSTKTMKRLADREPLFSPKSKRAIAARTEIGFGMARMYEMMRGDKPGEVRVFYSIEEATSWLGIEWESFSEAAPGEQ